MRPLKRHPWQHPDVQSSSSNSLVTKTQQAKTMALRLLIRNKCPLPQNQVLATTSEITAHNLTASLFLKLPSEVRNLIYEFVFGQHVWLIRPKPHVCANSAERGHGLFYVCRQTHTETINLPFSLLPFPIGQHLYPKPDTHRFFLGLSPIQLGSLRKVKYHLGPKLHHTSMYELVFLLQKSGVKQLLVMLTGNRLFVRFDEDKIVVKWAVTGYRSELTNVTIKYLVEMIKEWKSEGQVVYDKNMNEDEIPWWD